MNHAAYFGAHPRAPIKRQQGVSLLEVLVTMIVIAIGLLGLAGLQATTLKNGNTAYFRSQATMLSYDILDCMRANRPAAVLGSYNIGIGTSASLAGGVAGADVTAWKQNVDRSIPTGDGSISVDNAGNVTLIIQWDGDGDGVVTAGNGKDTKFTTQTRL